MRTVSTSRLRPVMAEMSGSGGDGLTPFVAHSLSDRPDGRFGEIGPGAEAGAPTALRR